MGILHAELKWGFCKGILYGYFKWGLVWVS